MNSGRGSASDESSKTASATIGTSPLSAPRRRVALGPLLSIAIARAGVYIWKRTAAQRVPILGQGVSMKFEHAKAKDGHFPLKVKLKPGHYKWCACGKTRDVPWCDGTCKGAKPVKFEIEKKEAVEICDCGLTKKPPFCDGSSHKKLKK
jgi:CDGSH-type Zn-finger protein